MKRTMLLVAALALIAATGCSTFTTSQTDTSYDESGKTLRAIRTQASASTFFDSKSTLTSFRAEQTDSSQSAEVGSLNQESSSTNLAPNIDALGRLIQAIK